MFIVQCRRRGITLSGNISLPTPPLRTLADTSVFLAASEAGLFLLSDYPLIFKEGQWQCGEHAHGLKQSLPTGCYCSESLLLRRC
jgi:hypothetical protein